ncbi:MAG TPA: lipopolysaccharide biosynthesis protein [Gemmatimonadales bacterium]|jgi:PST family polysaccharide transporter|nr:lipopolysaccharide biosynthesis protein [Gemmatimonadales bacterium]
MTSDERRGAPRGLTQRALGGMLWTFSGTGVQGAIQLLVMVALGRLLTPTEFGVMGAATVIIALSQIVSQVGVGPAIVQRRELEPVHIRVAFTISGVLGLLLGAAVWLAAPALAAFYRIPAVEPVLRGVALLFPIDGLNTVGESLLVRQLRFRLFVAVEVGSYILGYACIGVLLAWQGYGVWSLVAANLSQVSLRTIGMYVATRHPVRPSLDLRASRDLLSYGLGHSLAQVGNVLSQQGDNMVVGRWLGPQALGIYGRAYNLMVVPASVFGRIVNRVLFPVMAQVQDEPDRLAGAYERVLALVALMSLPVSAFLWVVAPEFIPTLLGPQWTGVVLPFRLFSCSLLFRMSSKVSDACTKAAGVVYARALVQGAYAALVVTGALIGQHWGVGGVAVAVSLAMGCNWVAMAALSRSVTGLSWSRFLRAQVPGAVFAALIGGTAGLAAQAARAAHLGKIPVLIAAGATAAACALAAATLRSEMFLGPHGAWASRRVGELLRRGSRRIGRPAGKPEPDALAEANPE